MAPPTVTYNNANASHTRYETNSTSGITYAERAIANAMISRDIAVFNSTAKPSSNTFATVTSPYDLKDSNYANNKLTHLMINNQENELGTVFAFAANHNPTNSPIDMHSSFPTTDGTISTGANVTTTVALDINSNSYYDSSIIVTTDNTENTFFGSDASGGQVNRYTVTFDTTNSNYNMQKAVNSRYSYSSSAPDTDKNDPLTIQESTTFNSNDAFLSEYKIIQNPTTGAYSRNITEEKLADNMSGLKYPLDASGVLLYSVTLDGSNAVTNDQIFFGAIKGEQGPSGTTVTGTAWKNDINEGDTATTLVSDQTGTAGPIIIQKYQPGDSTTPNSGLANYINSLFTAAEVNEKGGEYKLSIISREGGGYALENNTVGLTIDDSNLTRNIAYMNACSSEGNNFLSSAHSLVITNGELNKASSNSASNSGLLSAPINEIETLDNTNNAYASDFVVNSYFTEQQSNISSSYPRVSVDIDNTNGRYNYLRVVYDHTNPTENANATLGSLPESRRSVYNDKFTVTTVFPSTYIPGDTGTNPNYVGNSNNGFNAVFQSGKSGINRNTDYTFTVDASAASFLTSTEVAIIQLNNQLYMSEENSMYYEDPSTLVTTPIPNTRVTVLGENIDLTKYANNYNGSNLSNTSDMRIKLTAKTLSDFTTTFTNNWELTLLNNDTHVKTDLSTVDIFGNNIYDITANKNTIIPLNFTVQTNGTAANYDALDISLRVEWNWAGTNYKTFDATSFTLTTLTKELTSSTIVSPSNLSLIVSENTVIGNLLKDYNVVSNNETHIFNVAAKLPLGEYSNLGISSGIVTASNSFYTLIHKINGSRLGDHYLSYYRLFGSPLSSTRNLSGNVFSTATLSASDLYAYKGVVQYKLDGSGSGWVNASNIFDMDAAHNNVTTANLLDIDGDGILTNNGSMAISIDISRDPTLASTPLNNDTYYIGLTTSNLSLSYKVLATKLNVSNSTQFNALTSWSTSSDGIYSNSLPDGGTVLQPKTLGSPYTSLTAEVTTIPSSDTQLNIQPSVVITIKDQNEVVWGRFETSNKNATSSFNILFCANPLFSITEVYGDGSPISITTTKAAETSNTLKLIDGVELIFSTTTVAGDSATYVLHGDYINANLYAGYTDASGANYTTISEITPNRTLTIGVPGISRRINILRYRGNSVRTHITNTYEEFKWTRTPTKFSLKIVNSGISPSKIYTENPFTTYSGSTYTVNNLVDGSSAPIGELGLSFNSVYSRFVGSYDGSGVALPIIKPITVTFGSYTLKIVNPINGSTGTLPLTTTAERIISASNYSIVDFNGTYPNNWNIVASRVKVYEGESFAIEFGLPSMVFYYKSGFLASDVANTSGWNEFARYINDELRAGVRLPVPNSNPVIQSPIIIRRLTDNVGLNGHQGFFVMPKPQFSVNTVSTASVTSITTGLDFTNKTLINRYFNADFSSTNNTFIPFTGVAGTNSAMTVKFNSLTPESYIALRRTPNNKPVKIYVPSNKVTVDLYLGYIHSLAAFNSVANRPKLATVYSGYIHNLSSYTGGMTYSDTNTNTNINGTLNSNMSYNLRFSQPLSVISPSITSEQLYGAGFASGQIMNITVNNFRPYMNVGTTYSHIDLYSGSSLQMYLYGHRYKVVGGNLVVDITRYTSATGIDFTDVTTDGSGVPTAISVALRNLGFTPTRKQYARFTIKSGASALTSTPFNLLNDISSFMSTGGIPITDGSGTVLNFANNWTTDPDWVNTNTPLDFNFSALSTIGISMLQSLLSVSQRSPYRALVCQYDPYVNIVSADGSPIYIVTAFGALKAIRSVTSTIELSESSLVTPVTASAPNEYMSFNILSDTAL